MNQPITLFWFRRDLRLDDNVGFYEALRNEDNVLPIFIFDPHILESLPKDDARVIFIYETVQKMRQTLENKLGSSLAVFHGHPLNVFKELINTYTIKAVYTNRDYEPYARERDQEVKVLLDKHNIPFKTYKDHVIFEEDELVKSDGTPYVVYTPYMKLWKQTFKTDTLEIYKTEDYIKNLIKINNPPNLSLNAIGFKKSSQIILDYKINPQLILNYETTRNFPALDSTSRLGPHLRFGTVSIRKIIEMAISESNEIFLQELIWREFFIQILWHFPHTVTQSFKPQYDRIIWRNNEEEFKLWCQGNTGYPLVDAGMRQLNETGFMHNRIRMLVGSFLCKHLLIDWRWGEAYFAEKLHDYEMASNVGNWQWVAGCGVDAAPYFRIFNPTTQIEKFDKDLKYIKKWVPEFQEHTYTKPIVEHTFARERCLKVYKEALNEK